jgi:hypothetical protein
MMLVGAVSTAVFGGVDMRLLNGTYDIEIVPLGLTEGEGDAPIWDSLTIQFVTLASERLRQFGFQDPAHCGLAGGGSSVQFEHCEQRSSTHGLVRWGGRIDGNFIQGFMIWYKPGGEEVRHAFQGKKSEK